MYKIVHNLVAVPSSSQQIRVPGHITATSLELFLLTRHSARTRSSLAQFLSGMHSIGRLSRAIPWTSSGIARRSSLPVHLVISVISQLKGVCWLSSRSRSVTASQGSSTQQLVCLYCKPILDYFLSITISFRLLCVFSLLCVCLLISFSIICKAICCCNVLFTTLSLLQKLLEY